MKKLLPIIKLCLCVAVIAVAPSARAETCIGDAVSCTRDPATGKTTCITVVGPPCSQCDVSEVGSQSDTGFSIVTGLGLLGFAFSRRPSRR